MCLMGIGVFSHFSDTKITHRQLTLIRNHPNKTIGSKITCERFSPNRFFRQTKMQKSQNHHFFNLQFSTRRSVTNNKLEMQKNCRKKDQNNPWLISYACTFTSSNKSNGEFAVHHHTYTLHIVSILLFETSSIDRPFVRPTDRPTERHCEKSTYIST